MLSPRLKPKTCKVKTCRAPFTPNRRFQTWCSPDCGLAIVEAKRAKEAVLREKRERQSVKERKNKLKTRRDYLVEAQTAINRYVRWRDRNKGCVSCGSHPEQRYGGTMDCGHYRSVGTAPQLRFNLKNMASQCVKCNRYLGSNTVQYRTGLIARIGIGSVEDLERDNRPAKFSVDHLKRLSAVFRRKLRISMNRTRGAENGDSWSDEVSGECR